MRLHSESSFSQPTTAFYCISEATTSGDGFSLEVKTYAAGFDAQGNFVPTVGFFYIHSNSAQERLDGYKKALNKEENRGNLATAEEVRVTTEAMLIFGDLHNGRKTIDDVNEMLRPKAESFITQFITHNRVLVGNLEEGYLDRHAFDASDPNNNFLMPELRR